MKSFAWIPIPFPRDSKAYLLGLGPFSESPVLWKERPAFYIQDFFLSDPAPWKYPAEVLELTKDEFSQWLKLNGEDFKVDWEPLEARGFFEEFRSLRACFESGTLNKGVPVVFEEGRFFGSPKILAARSIEFIDRGLYPYGFIGEQESMIGLSPEFLFKKSGDACQTMALAGTAKVENAQNLLRDPKELREHELVVRDLLERLKFVRDLEVKPLGLRELPGLAHLETIIEFKSDALFSELVGLLHPTPALGVSPRGAVGTNWLKENTKERKYFGAPFGARLSDATEFCLVAIRNVLIEGERLRLGAGCGVISESIELREWDELKLKRDSVKKRLGL